MSGSLPEGPPAAAMSSFNRKCSLLTQYLKEKGSFGDLSLGMITPTTCITTTTTTTKAQGGGGSVVLPRTGQIKSMDLFPQQVGFGSDKEEILNSVVADKTSARKADTAQMTIFYAGKVIVLDDFPADKVKEVMLLAGRSSSKFYSASAIADLPHEAVKASNEPGRIVLPVARTTEPVAWDLPITRTKSLYRFLEKRKDRITSRAPYPQINTTISSTGSPISKPVESNKSWLSLSAESHQ